MNPRVSLPTSLAKTRELQVLIQRCLYLFTALLCSLSERSERARDKACVSRKGAKIAKEY